MKDKLKPKPKKIQVSMTIMQDSVDVIDHIRNGHSIGKGVDQICKTYGKDTKQLKEKQ